MTVMHMGSRHLPAADVATDRAGSPMAGGACGQVKDKELFFPSVTHRSQAREAKEVCRRCPVQAKCLQWALDTEQDVGVLGGLTEQERREIHGRRPAHRREPGMPPRVQELTAAPEPLLAVLEEGGLTLFQIACRLRTNVATVKQVCQLLADDDDAPAVLRDLEWLS